MGRAWGIAVRTVVWTVKGSSPENRLVDILARLRPVAGPAGVTVRVDETFDQSVVRAHFAVATSTGSKAAFPLAGKASSSRSACPAPGSERPLLL